MNLACGKRYAACLVSRTFAGIGDRELPEEARQALSLEYFQLGTNSHYERPVDFRGKMSRPQAVNCYGPVYTGPFSSLGYMDYDAAVLGTESGRWRVTMIDQTGNTGWTGPDLIP